MMHSDRLWAGLIGASMLALAACGEQTETAAVDGTEGAEPAAEQAEWTYANASEWGNLGTDYAVCGTGTEQSPINLAGAREGDLPDPAVEYQPAPLEAANLGHTVQVNYAPGSAIMLDGTRFELAQFSAIGTSNRPVQPLGERELVLDT